MIPKINEWLAFCSAFLNIRRSGVLSYRTVWLLNGWCHVKLLLSRFAYTIQSWTMSRRFTQSQVRRVHTCLAITCHLRLWAEWPGATVVTRAVLYLKLTQAQQEDHPEWGVTVGKPTNGGLTERYFSPQVYVQACTLRRRPTQSIHWGWRKYCGVLRFIHERNKCTHGSKTNVNSPADHWKRTAILSHVEAVELVVRNTSSWVTPVWI